MSKGEIVSHLGEGKYLVRQKLAKETIDQELSGLQQRIADIAIELPNAKLALIAAENGVKSLAHAIDLLIPDLIAGVDGTRQKIADLQGGLIKQRSAARQLEIKVAQLQAEKLAALKRRNVLEQVPEERELVAWCADHTEDLVGTVGLVDINDEGGQGVVIQPGFEGAAAYAPARDGALFPGLGQSGIQIYFNAAILPGVQKWQPRYRVGVISNIENDSCTVTLDDAKSSAQGLDINREKVLTGVPIQYMDCNGNAFEDDDRVVVRFTQNGPLVVGFESEPKRCDLPVWIGGVWQVNGITNVVFEMEPDFSDVRRSVVVRSDNTGVAVFDDQVAVIYQDAGNNESGLAFSGGPTHTATLPDDKYFGITSGPSGFCALRLNYDPIDNVYAESFDAAGGFASSVILGGLSGEQADAISGATFGTDGQIITASDNNYGLGGDGFEGFFPAIFDASSGTRLSTNGSSDRDPLGAVTDKYVILATATLPGNHWTARVYRRGTMDLIQTISLPKLQYRCCTASRTKFYAFSIDSGGALTEWDCRVQIFRLSDQGLTFESDVDLNARFGMATVFGADVDGALLFK